MKDELLRFSNCNKLDWILFDPHVPQNFSHEFCSKWGGVWVNPDLCRSQKPAETDIPLGLPDRCLEEL